MWGFGVVCFIAFRLWVGCLGWGLIAAASVATTMRTDFLEMLIKLNSKSADSDFVPQAMSSPCNDSRCVVVRNCGLDQISERLKGSETLDCAVDDLALGVIHIVLIVAGIGWGGLRVTAAPRCKKQARGRGWGLCFK